MLALPTATLPAHAGPTPHIDPLADVLRAVRLDGAYFFPVEAAAPWSVEAAPAHELAPRVLPGAEHLVSYHVVVAGTVYAGLTGTTLERLDPGDVIIFPHGDGHVVASAPDPAFIPRATAVPARYPQLFRLGPAGRPDASFVCGFLGMSRGPFNPLLGSFPPMLVVRGASVGWLAGFPQMVVDASRSAAESSLPILARMAELMFLESLGCYAMGGAPSGWLAGLADPLVGVALRHMHSAPGRPWTLALLARACATSRSVLADRFTKVVGVPLMLYLMKWRLQLAAEQLTTTDYTVRAIATRVGYTSEAAFCRAFKRHTGQTPAQWRGRRDDLPPAEAVCDAGPRHSLRLRDMNQSPR
ncbi:MAG: AraC family transcriptional regulator [Gemmatimonadaceae bacterium]|jgi:AraC-like DNA-binding protein|nr:AraC family transcriptional regulator [Gemmatimonadaceae bacterium]